MGSSAAAVLAFLFCSVGRSSCLKGVELSFEDKYLGFFLKSGHEESPQADSVLNRDQFLVLQPSRATMVRVGYGPFTAKQTVPYPSSLPLVSFNQSMDLFSHWPATTDVTAYLVTKEVPRERPVLRVLFHFTQSGRDASSGSPQNYQNLCVVLVASYDGRRRTGVCSPTSREATCLVELVVPHVWWPPFHATAAKGVKVQKTMIAVEYAVAVDMRRAECSEANIKVSSPSQLTTTPLWHVPLSPNPVHYAEVMENGSLQILVPKATLFPRSKLYIPVFVKKNPDLPVNVFVMSATAKSGLRILEVEAFSNNGWSITLDLNAKRTVASVTAFYQNPEKNEKRPFAEDFEEVFSWLLEVDNGMNLQHSARVSWSVRYVQKAGRAVRRNALDGGINMTTDLEVQKDDIQSVLLVSKTWELVNTAFLNGKQVSLPIKIFIVSQAGKMADVTLQSSCHSADDSILKVSPSCTSVYLDGSEIRGSHNASVVVKYGSYTGYAQFKVWLPKLPLEIHVEDDRLSQIRNWKAPKEIARKLIPRTRYVKKDLNRSIGIKRSLRPRTDHNKWMCRLRYQQTPIEVFAKFIAVDENSGREAYLLNRKTAFRVTELVEDYLRIADPRIAVLKGRIIQGQSIGRTEIQILSPITGLVSGATELRVGKEKETITGVRLGVVTGLQLSIKPSYEVANGFVAETTITHQLTAQYQEGLLDISIVFSDGTSTPLSQIAEGDFSLLLQARERHVVALAPMASSHRPRVIALGEGVGAIHVSLEMAEECSRHQASPLGSSLVNITVKIKKPTDKIGLQNDGYHPEKKFSNSFRYEQGLREPSVQARQNVAAHVADMSPLEIGMYALLGIFCLAIVVFVASCATYAVQFHKKQVDHYDRKDPVANAHDWVWLGRATLERKALSQPPPPTVAFAPRRGEFCEASAGATQKRTRLNSDILSVTNENAIPFCDSSAAAAEPETSLLPRERRVQIVVNPLDTASSESDHSLPPPVPPHGRPMPSQRASSCYVPPPLQHKGLPWVSPECPLDYDVLIEYFDNLKESNA